MTHRAKPLFASEAEVAHALPDARPGQALHHLADVDGRQGVKAGNCIDDHHLRHAHEPGSYTIMSCHSSLCVVETAYKHLQIASCNCHAVLEQVIRSADGSCPFRQGTLQSQLYILKNLLQWSPECSVEHPMAIAGQTFFWDCAHATDTCSRGHARVL